MPAKETLNKLLRGRIAALRGARPLAYLVDMSRLLRSVRLALHPARCFFQRFPNSQVSAAPVGSADTSGIGPMGRRANVTRDHGGRHRRRRATMRIGSASRDILAKTWCSVTPSSAPRLLKNVARMGKCEAHGAQRLKTHQIG